MQKRAGAEAYGAIPLRSTAKVPAP